MVRAGKVAVGCLFVALLASCSGSAFPGAGARNVTTTTAAPTRPVTSSTEPDLHRQYAVEIAEGLGTEAHKIEGMTGGQTACVAAAMLDGVGLDRFRAAGVSPDEMRESGHLLPTRLGNTLPEPVRRDIGNRLQGCDVAYMMAKPMFVGLSKELVSDFADEPCMSLSLSAPAHQLVVGDFVIVTTPTAADASALADVFLQCVRFGDVTVHDLGATASDGEIKCIDTQSRTDPVMHQAAADAFIGITSGSNLGYGLARVWARCLTPAHLRILANHPNRPVDV
jgi:hypothetical protein